MGRRIIAFAHNVDALVPLILGIAVSVLGLFNIASPQVVDNSILIVLAVLSFALLRERWIKDSSAKEARTAAAEALVKLQAIERGISPLATINQLAERMQVTVEGMAAVKTLKGADIDREHEQARVRTDRWMFKGGTGTYTRAMTLPLCVENARRERRSLQVRLEILDPTNTALCARYAGYRKSQSPGPDGTGEPWTTERTQKEAFATVLAAHWYQQAFQPLDIGVGLTSTMSIFRFDMSESRLIITQDDPRFPAIIISNTSPLYESYATELRVSMSQARHVPLESASAVLGERPAVAQVREFFAAVNVALPDDYGDADITQIIDKAIRAKNPYGRESYETDDRRSASGTVSVADAQVSLTTKRGNHAPWILT
jgi:hypothetical protein